MLPKDIVVFLEEPDPMTDDWRSPLTSPRAGMPV
jgi:hypothetical protein